ncbi:DUF4276 family protein [Desulfobotulus sp. H1]|uniref:DUF4276 family protein n=1 Tax=Desulfobotulus pelophilus TaxID=2823377 RepID=A0ABT3N7W3_9BACT|nr:DUF4276 family protein [Desulfobotulus pelophilus]MCW7753546.1 DUF4276 family protein [Desulfobotulus pelophilus]
MPENWSVLVLVDRDDDCSVLKHKLEQAAIRSGFITKRSAASGQRFNITNRIVIEELKAWYFGDWNAVKAAYPKVPVTIPQKAPYCNPDAISGGTWEALERVLKQAGYFSTGLRKAECAREIAMLMDIHQNRSGSFNIFLTAIQAISRGNLT